MNAGFPHHAVECGQPRKCVLQSPGYRRRGRNVSSLAAHRRLSLGCGAPDLTAKPPPRGPDIANDGLAALMDMDVLDRDPLRAFSTMSVQGFEQCCMRARELRQFDRVAQHEIARPIVRRIVGGF
jgi:hypothetical protein